MVSLYCHNSAATSRAIIDMQLELQQQRLAWAVFTIAAIALLILLFLVNPVQASWFPACPFHKFTGLDCPGCGSMRGLHSLLHGHILEALDYNLLLLPSIPLLATGFYHKVTARGASAWMLFNRPVLALWIVICFWILRNIPVSAFSWLSAGV
jgi:hypothetical protein